jgi:hypothetical protein
MNMWVPLMGYNVRYRENYDINPSNLHVRRSDTGRRVRTTNTGRLMLHGKWVHIADVVRDHRALRLVRNADDECDDDEEDYDFKGDSEADDQEEEEEEEEVQIVEESPRCDEDEEDDEEEELEAAAPAAAPVVIHSNARGFVIWLSTVWNICVLMALIAYIWSRESSAASSATAPPPNGVYYWA